MKMCWCIDVIIIIIIILITAMKWMMKKTRLFEMKKMEMERELKWIKKKEKVFNCRQNIFFVLNILSIELYCFLSASSVARLDRPYILPRPLHSLRSYTDLIAGGQPVTVL